MLTGRRDIARGAQEGCGNCTRWGLHGRIWIPAWHWSLLCKAQCPYKRVRPDELESAISLAGTPLWAQVLLRRGQPQPSEQRRMKEGPSPLLLCFFWILPQIQMAPFTFSSIQQFPPTGCSSLPCWFWLPTVMTASSLPEQLPRSCCQLCFLE